MRLFAILLALAATALALPACDNTDYCAELKPICERCPSSTDGITCAAIPVADDNGLCEDAVDEYEKKCPPLPPKFNWTCNSSTACGGAPTTDQVPLCADQASIDSARADIIGSCPDGCTCTFDCTQGGPC